MTRTPKAKLKFDLRKIGGINLWTGTKPTKRTLEMLAWYFAGVASEAEMLRHITERQKTKA